MTQEEYKKKLQNYYDETGLLKQYPSKKPLRELVLASIAQGFEEGKDYTEKEVNQVILSQIAFTDVELIRRELFQAKFLGRLRDGSRYWKETKSEMK